MKQEYDKLWPKGPSQPEFPVNRVDVWRVKINKSLGEAVEVGGLSSDEIERANRFLFEKDRLRFTRCRSVLRRLLACYLSILPAEIGFEYSAGGKPSLLAGQNPRGLQFNVSHSGVVALIAISDVRSLGVDVEKVRDDVDTFGIAERFFSPRERVCLRALPDPLRVPGFFACWTRKEAFIKATGKGLSFPLVDFSVTTHPNLEPALEELRGNTEARRQWSLADIKVQEGYRAAVAADHPRLRIETYAWD